MLRNQIVWCFYKGINNHEIMKKQFPEGGKINLINKITPILAAVRKGNPSKQGLKQLMLKINGFALPASSEKVIHQNKD